MTNEEKARQLANILMGADQNDKPLVEVLLRMAEWKEQQMKIKANMAFCKITCKGYQESKKCFVEDCKSLNDFRKAMKGE